MVYQIFYLKFPVVTVYWITDARMGTWAQESWHNVCGIVIHRDSPPSWIKRARRAHPFKKKECGSITGINNFDFVVTKNCPLAIGFQPKEF